MGTLVSLRKELDVLDPDTLANVRRALEETLRRVDLQESETQVGVAATIVSIARSGVSDPDKLAALTLQELRIGRVGVVRRGRVALAAMMRPVPAAQLAAAPPDATS